MEKGAPLVTSTSLAKATMSLLELALSAVSRVGASALLLIPEGSMDWDAVRTLAQDVRMMVAVETTRMEDAVKAAGLIALAVEPTEAAITERITLALIEAVANDLLAAGDRVVVAYSGFEAEVLDSITVVRLGEHLERLSSRDLRALETSVPIETLKAVVDVAVEIGREGREGKAVGSLIVVGDSRNVLSRTRALGFDPFKGYLAQRAERPRRQGPRGDQGDRPDGRSLRRRPRRHGRGRLSDRRRPQRRPHAPQRAGNPPLGRRRDHQGHQGVPSHRRQPVHRQPSACSRTEKSSSESLQCATPGP